MPENHDRLEVLSRVANDVEASLIVQRLADYGITASAVGGFTSGFRAEAPGDVAILVKQDDLARAKSVLASIRQEHLAEHAADDETDDEEDEPMRPAPPKTRSLNENSKNANWPLGLIGAIGGGILGYLVFLLLASQGLYGLVIPGATLGWGGGRLLKGKSQAFGAVCGFLGIVLGILAEWQFAPFIADPGFAYFITHLYNLEVVTLIMIVIGGLCAFWFGQGRE
jgi:hypothetical protein